MTRVDRASFLLGHDNKSIAPRQHATYFSERVLKKLSSRSNPQWLSNRLKTDLRKFGGGYILQNIKSPHPVLEELGKVCAKPHALDFGFALLECLPADFLKGPNILEECWNSHIGSTAIPMSFDDRKAEFPTAFADLSERIDYHRQQCQARSD